MDMTLSLDQTLTHTAWFLVVGIAVVGFLLGAFKLGQRVRAKEPPPPTAESQPHLPNGGAVYEVREERDSVEIPEGGLRPHEMQGYGNFGSTTSSHPDDVREERESGYRNPPQYPGPQQPPKGEPPRYKPTGNA
ncbi:DUF6479 family protein [Streptomyces sp. NPDC050448]|uniref:DUF6479 family protein n=1 Tax=Streptomyces sp. NPDC050448 TaxID=3155404 RepID=UPI0034231EEC